MYDKNNTSVQDACLMSEQAFRYHQTQRLQNLELNDQNELRETARNYRLMERDAHKSMLRQQEYAVKQLQRVKSSEILETGHGIILLTKNGDKKVLKNQLLLNCHIQRLFRFKRYVVGTCFWQLSIKNGSQEIFSELYPVEFLQSLSKLKTTILSRFDCTVSPNDKTMLWNWLRAKLFDLYEEAEMVELPFLAGWFLICGKWRFWVQSEEVDLLAGEIISQFTMEAFCKKSGKEVTDNLLDMFSYIENSASLSVLLIFSLLALTSRLAADSPPPMGLTLIGRNSVKLAKRFLSTMGCEAGWDVINLDSDRIGLVRKAVSRLQDTPIILASVASNSRSTQNRLQEIMSWLDSGLMEGQKITFPFIFCLQNFSPVYPLDNTIVLALDEMQISDDFKVFGELQEFIIQQVENGGEYWAGEFRNRYGKLQKILSDEERETVLHIGKAVTSTVLKMLDLEGERQEKIQEFFDMGLDKIKRQLTAGSNTLLETFRQAVMKLVDTGILFVRSRQPDAGVPDSSSDSKPNTEVIYYDDSHYYFPKPAFQEIGRQYDLDSKSILFIKQQLISEGFVKQYRATGGRCSELEADIFVGNAGSKRKLSVFAIKKEFWDTAGGIALYERSDGLNENFMRR